MRRSSGTSRALVPHKGHRHLIEAAHLVVQQLPDARFVILGEGELREHLERLVREHHLEKHVLLPGFRIDVLGCIKAFDLFVMSSVTEGLGTSLLDAMACSKAIVATRGRRYSRSRRRRGHRAPGGAPRSSRPGCRNRQADQGRRRFASGWLTRDSSGCLRAIYRRTDGRRRPRTFTRAWPAHPTQRTLRIPLGAAESARVHHPEMAEREVVSHGV